MLAQRPRSRADGQHNRSHRSRPWPTAQGVVPKRQRAPPSATMRDEILNGKRSGP
jgi:hypothetical protein